MCFDRTIDRQSGFSVATDETGAEVRFNRSSVNSICNSFPTEYFTYYEKKEYAPNRIFLLDSSNVTPVALLFATPQSSIGNTLRKSLDFLIYLMAIFFLFSVGNGTEYFFTLGKSYRASVARKDMLIIQVTNNSITQFNVLSNQ